MYLPPATKQTITAIEKYFSVSEQAYKNTKTEINYNSFYHP
jgi:hypothetical protein